MEKLPEIKTVKGNEVKNIQIPICCIENWKNCPHKAKPQKKVKRNIGL